MGLVLLASTSSGIEIKCNYEMYVWDLTGEHYTCNPSVITNSTNPKHVTEITGTHLAWKNNSDVGSFTIEPNNELERLPKGIGKIFPNLLVLRWVGGNLKSVSAKDLKHFRKLIGVTFRVNKIHSLDADLFRHTRSLQIVSFKSNGLTHVGSGLLEGLDDLFAAQFLDNPCIDYQAMSKTEVVTLKAMLEKTCVAPMAQWYYATDIENVFNQ